MSIALLRKYYQFIIHIIVYSSTYFSRNLIIIFRLIQYDEANINLKLPNIVSLPAIHDSYMGIIFPDDIIQRVQRFMSGKENFPFIDKDELMSIFFLYGKRTGICGRYETYQAYDLAERTAINLDRYIQSLSYKRDAKLDPEFLRCQFVNRALQLVSGPNQPISNDHACHDPVILSNSFASHISYYNQDYFFQLYGPLLKEQVTVKARELLVGRIVLIGYNRKEDKDLPYPSPLSPLYVYIVSLCGFNPA